MKKHYKITQKKYK